MKLDVLGVQAFVALAERCSFRKAAEALFISQTALSRRIQNLEQHLGVRLVDRTTRSVALSRVGAEFLPQARRLLGELEGALLEIRERRESLSGQVTMACVPTVGVRFLPLALQSYAQAHASTRVRVLDDTSAGVTEAVVSRAAEFGITIAGRLPPELEGEEILHDRFVLVCPHEHRLASRPRVAWADLAGESLILPGPGSSNRPLLDEQLPSGVVLQPRFEVQRSATAIGLVAAGAGITVVPDLALQPGAYAGLMAVPLVRPATSRAFVLVTYRGGSLSPAAEALVAIIRRTARGNWRRSPAGPPSTAPAREPSLPSGGARTGSSAPS